MEEEIIIMVVVVIIVLARLDERKQDSQHCSSQQF